MIKMKKANKKTLFIIIILLAIFIPLSVYSTVMHYVYQSYVPPSCDITLYNGTCYGCTYPNGYCGFARNYIEDDTYRLNYYKPDALSYVTVPSGYAFIVDTNLTTDGVNYLEDAGAIIYNLKTLEKTFIKGIKNYNVGIADDYYIVINNENKYGIVTFTDTINTIIDYKYDFIGLANNLNADGKLDNSKLIVSEDGKWKLVDKNDNALTVNFAQPIYDYNDSHVVLSIGNSYQIFNYNNQALSSETFMKVILYDKYIGVIDLDKRFYVYDCSTEQIISDRYKAEVYDDIYLEIIDGTLYIYMNGEVLETQ